MKSSRKNFKIADEASRILSILQKTLSPLKFKTNGLG